jgi:hypothetical protein
MSLADLWMLPTSLLGLLLAVLGGARPYAVRPNGSWWWVGSHGIWGWFFTHEDRTATTIGGIVVVAPRRKDSPNVIAHEAIHVKQGRRWGPLFVPAYFAIAAWLWLHGKRPYEDHPWELAAIAAAAGLPV